MIKLQEWMTKVAPVVSRLKQGKASHDDKVLLSSLILTVAFFIVLILTIRLWFVPVLILMFGIYKIAERLRPVSQAPSYNLVDSAVREMYAVLCEVHDRIDARRPLDVQDIVVMPYVTNRNGIEMVTVRVAKLKRGKCEREDLQLFAKIIQARIVARLREGIVANIPYSFTNGNVPIFVIDRVYDDMVTLHIDVITVDDDNKWRYVVNPKIADTTSPSPEPIDEDF